MSMPGKITSLAVDRLLTGKVSWYDRREREIALKEAAEEAEGSEEVEVVEEAGGLDLDAGLGIVTCLLLIVALVLVILFPPALAFVEMAARQLRYLWWLVLLLALGIWLIVGARKSKD